MSHSEATADPNGNSGATSYTKGSEAKRRKGFPTRAHYGIKSDVCVVQIAHTHVI